MAKKHSFCVYIDEAGDEGFNFSGRTREWFIVSAALTRREDDFEALSSIFRPVRKMFRFSDKQEVHFRKLTHDKRRAYLNAIANTQTVKAITVAVYKPGLDRERFSKGKLLYAYACRLLLERVSWFCRDYYKKTENIGDGTPLLCFSKRKQVSYDDIKEYFLKLKELSTTIDWNFIDEQQFHVYASAQCMGLQIADAVASSTYQYLNKNDYGMTDSTYLNMLKPVLYCHNGRIDGYGYKKFGA